MKRLVPLFLLLSLFTCAAVAMAAETVPCYVHMVVIPDTLPDGSTSVDVIDEFESEVMKLSGGFTQLGPSQGSDIVKGDEVYQDNMTYLIGADKDITAKLHALTVKYFGEPGGFIMAWPGTMTQ
ncbi:hypothetical protein [Pseudodesulfovibrio indicus]|uniref:hypothetical protein n=1 Tax=Pseudodesulfovibrio indicus TaxID=1716143 RepID=UPI00292EDAC0|nr:hypothetical protein [Pseudodesulfovibrio indicus]